MTLFALPCPALPCPALPCPKPRFRLKRPFIQSHLYLPSAVGAVLSITLLFTHNAHAQSNWWEQAKRNRPPPPPTSVEQTSPPPPVQPLALPPVSASQEQEIDTANTPAQNNTTANVKEIPIFSYIEIGISEIEFTDESPYTGTYTGRYLGVCLEWLCGSYQVPAADVAITEVGIVSSYRRQPQLQFIGALTWQRWEIVEADRRLTKLMIGLQAHLSQSLDVWVNTGYLWTRKYTNYYNRKGEIVKTDFFSTTVQKMGMQIFLTPTLGIILEADFLKDMDFDFYRIGIRFNF